MGKVSKKLPPARNPEIRENQLINLALDLVEKQLQEGTATSQVITHFLKLATMKEQLENEKLKSDLKVAEAKIKHIENQDNIQKMYEQAMNAMRIYSGEQNEEFDEEEIF